MRTVDVRSPRGRSVAALAWVAAGVLTLTLTSQDTVAKEPTVSSRKKAETIEFKDARIKFEINATDDDGGIQIFIDADGWKMVQVFDPKGNEIFESITRGIIRKQGGTELFLESAEPGFDELPLEQLLERFPEGRYRFRARGLEGERIVSEATLTHNIPDGPRLVSPLEGGPLQDPNQTTVVWEAVPPPNGSPIIGYQVLVVLPNSGLPALPKVVLDVMMPPAATSLDVPPGFLRPDTTYEWEVLAIEASGNQTLSSEFFSTAP